jgi:hypothetical protein
VCSDAQELDKNEFQNCSLLLKCIQRFFRDDPDHEEPLLIQQGLIPKISVLYSKAGGLAQLRETGGAEGAAQWWRTCLRGLSLQIGGRDKVTTSMPGAWWCMLFCLTLVGRGRWISEFEASLVYRGVPGQTVVPRETLFPRNKTKSLVLN